MRLLDSLLAKSRDRTEQGVLGLLTKKHAAGAGKRGDVLASAPLPDLAAQILDYEGVFSPVSPPQHPSPAEVVQAENLLRKLLALQEGTNAELALSGLLTPLAASLPPLPEGEDFGLTVSVLERLASPPAVLDELVKACLASPLPRLARTVQENLLLASGIDPTSPGSRKTLVLPSASKETDANTLVAIYLRGTPFVDFFRESAPFAIPSGVRFEHTHIVGGSGHGKTQLLQTLILRDLDELEAKGASLIVIDSQGDMISTITRLSALSPRVEKSLADRLVLIDPNDIEHPPCLNLFDFGLERLSGYSLVEREKLLNGAIALYEYMFGALLGAELTERQGVIFRYLGRLLMTIPGATIHTLVTFMEDPEAARSHFEKLEGSARHFFETQFASAAFKDTRQQILNRLWGILSNAVLERLFSNEKNKINIFEAINNGKIILINTAKDLLKHDGCAILGRFFIALITQAAQERASIPAEKRPATYFYIDEAQDYFDESAGELFNQARKYKVGLTVAHQNLDQLKHELRASILASTAIKLVGGMSAWDATAFAKEMRCDREFLQSMRKSTEHTEFACFVRNVTPAPLRLRVPFGAMEARPRMTEAEHEELLNLSRGRYGAGSTDTQAGIGHGDPGEGFTLGRPEIF